MSHFGPDITFQFDIVDADGLCSATLTTPTVYQVFFCSVCQLTCVCVRARTTMISRLKHRVADIEVALRTTYVKKQHQSRVRMRYYFVKCSVLRFHYCVVDNHCIGKFYRFIKKMTQSRNSKSATIFIVILNQIQSSVSRYNL